MPRGVRAYWPSYRPRYVNVPGKPLFRRVMRAAKIRLKHLIECRATLFQRLFASSSDLDLVCREFLAGGNQSDL